MLDAINVWQRPQESSRNCGCFVFTSSGGVYAENEGGTIDEESEVKTDAQDVRRRSCIVDAGRLKFTQPSANFATFALSLRRGCMSSVAQSMSYSRQGRTLINWTVWTMVYEWIPLAILVLHSLATMVNR